MQCNDPGPLGPCSINRFAPSLKHAGENVGIDLEKPIDLSQMRVNSISHHLQDVANGFKLEVVRETELETFVINEYGEREFLTITFSLRSQRMAKFTDDEPKTQG